jgi:hypothetical protein
MEEKARFTKEDIGGEILPILTTGLYKDILDTIREYIQNAIDAQSQRIEIVIDPDTITITDDGSGMNLQGAKKAIKLGVSEKNPLENVGFRGIGIYSAFNLCNTLEIYTKSASEDLCNIIHFDFKRMREALLKDQEQRKRGKPSSLYLEKLLSDTVTVGIDKTKTLKEQGTKAIMFDLLEDVYRRLNNWDEIMGYLQDVVPLPFQPNFKYANAIKKKFEQEDYRVVPLVLQIGSQREEIYRPYNNDMFTHGGEHPPKFFDISSGKEKFGFAWVCISDARQVLRTSKLRGFLIKKFGFSISDRNYLEPYFGRTVINRRITGEVIVRHANLIPNAARSDFEHNSTRQAFLEALPKFILEVTSWANKIQDEDKAKEVLAQISEEIIQINKTLRMSARDKERVLLLNVTLHDLSEQLKRHSKILKQTRTQQFDQTSSLLRECQDFVKALLVEQKKVKETVEKKIIRSIQRDTEFPLGEKEKEGLLKDVPANIIELIGAYGLPVSAELTDFLKFLDENFLQVRLSDEAYKEMIATLREYMEGRF